jgi:Ni,Fe-hydrogenase III large subunit/Ni,Fe-hydrogenase III component G
MISPSKNIVALSELPEVAKSHWSSKVKVGVDAGKRMATVDCQVAEMPEVCGWLFSHSYNFATLVVQEGAAEWSLRYIFYGSQGSGLVHVTVGLPKDQLVVPSISLQVHAVDWHERQAEDLFGLTFEGHPKLGDFVLHEEWPEGVNPMRASFDPSRRYPHCEPDPVWRPSPIVQSPGAFMMPIGPVYSDQSESALFLLETVGEDVIRTIPHFFYKYRGVEKIAEGSSVDRVLLLAERFSGTSAFAHSLAFCQAVEEIGGVVVPARAQALRVLLAELERLRHHVAAIGGICHSTALAVATSQANILEEDQLRLAGALTGHRYLFGLNLPGGLSLDLSDEECRRVGQSAQAITGRLSELREMLRFTNSFLDRVEKVGIVTGQAAATYGLVGPVARASGLAIDLRKILPYGLYELPLSFSVPCEKEGDGYARLRILFQEAEQSANIIQEVASSLPGGPVCTSAPLRGGSALGWVEAPRGAAFHWVSVGENGRVTRYRVTTPSFTNWHGFHLAAEEFAFQDFPIILATFGLSNAESDC